MGWVEGGWCCHGSTNDTTPCPVRPGPFEVTSAEASVQKLNDLSLLCVVRSCSMFDVSDSDSCEGGNKAASRLALNSYSIKTNWNK